MDNFDNPNIADLFNNPNDEPEFVVDEVEDEEELSYPSVTVMLPGSFPLPVTMVRPEATVQQILNDANVTFRPGEQEIWIDGQPAGLDALVQAGSTITATGRAKGG